MAEMTAQEAAEWGKTLSFETVWATLQEVGRKQDKTEKLIDKTAKEIADLKATVERVSNNVGGLNRSLGELVETLLAARLWEKFPEYGLTRAYQRLPIYDNDNQLKTDIDILLVNTDMCMAVEVKHRLNRTDEVDYHVKRMQLIRQYPPELVNSKRLIGAMAGGAVDPEIKNYIYRCGFFVLELTGESVRLIPPPEGFVPKKW
ncbi:MAG: hypothetical protein LBP29_08520 [Treponema sp.]|jgi:hypothetical protein|nr:hypothetical protein [Treponema sp.]